MAKRWVHYEAAFEDLLRSRGWAYVPIDEAKRSIFAGLRVKSFDFVLHTPAGEEWLCDVKGRRVKVSAAGRLSGFETWVALEDLEALQQWQEVFGERFRAVLVFAYWLDAPADLDLAASVDGPLRDELVASRGRTYLFRAVPVADYLRYMRQRSARWKTLAVARAAFREISRPLVALCEGRCPGGPSIAGLTSGQ